LHGSQRRPGALAVVLTLSAARKTLERARDHEDLDREMPSRTTAVIAKTSERTVPADRARRRDALGSSPLVEAAGSERPRTEVNRPTKEDEDARLTLPARSSSCLPIHRPASGLGPSRQLTAVIPAMQAVRERAVDALSQALAPRSGSARRRTGAVPGPATDEHPPLSDGSLRISPWFELDPAGQVSLA